MYDEKINFICIKLNDFDQNDFFKLAANFEMEFL